MRKNFKKVLLLTLVLLIAISMFVINASAANGNVAKIGDTEYATLQAAIDAAKPGDTVTLLKDVTLGTYVQGKSDAAITINKAITLDGNGNTLTSQAGRAINIDVAGEVEIKNLTIKQYCGRNSSDQKRCINVINQTATVKVTGCTLEMVEHYASGRTLTSYVAGVQAATGANHNITIDGCNIKTIYGIVVYAAGSEIDVKYSNISNALYGAWINAECDIDIVQSTITTKEDMGTNNLAIAFLAQSADVSITADENTTINVPAPKGADGNQTGGQGFALYSSSKMADIDVDLSKATINKTKADDPVVYLAGAEAQIYRENGTVMFDTLDDAIKSLTPEDSFDQLESLTGETPTVDDVNEKLEELERDFSYNEDGTVNVAPKFIAQIGDVQYATLAEALEAAKAGDTITFIDNINENVTINKAVKIYGADKTYTGKMTIEIPNVEIKINNVNFVKGNILVAKDTSKGTTLTLNNCNFDGVDKSIDHAMQIGDIEQLIINGGSVTNYKLSAVYVPSANSKDVIINGTTFDSIGSYTIRIASGMGAQLSNVTIKNVYGGILADTAKEYRFTNCVFENVTLPITSWTGTLTGKFIFNGENIVPNLSTREGGSFVLALGATLTAPEGLLDDIKTDVENAKVVYDYENGVYSVHKHAFGEPTIKYPTYTEKGSKTYTCTDCNDKSVVEIEALDPIKIAMTNTRFGSDFSLLFAFEVDDNVDLTNIYAVITHEYEHTYEDETKELKTKSVTIEASNWSTTNINGKQYYVVEYTGIAAKQMGDKISIEIFDANGNKISEAKTMSLCDYALSRLGKTTNAAFKTALVDMLNYGAAAQVKFEYKTDELVNSELGEYADLASEEFETINGERSITVSDEYRKMVKFKGSNLRFDNKTNLVIAVNFTGSKQEGYAIFKWTDHSGKSHEVKVGFTDVDGRRAVELDQLAIADARQEVTCTIYASDGTPMMTIKDALAFNVQREVSDNATSGFEELYNAYMLFADSAYAYLHPQNNQ